MLAYFFFFISLKYIFLFIFYLSGGKTYQPALVLASGHVAPHSVFWLGHELDNPGFESQQRQAICLVSSTFKPSLGSTQLPIQWVLEAPFLGVKRQGVWGWSLTPQARAQDTNEWSYIYTSLARLYGVHRNNFTCTIDVYKLDMFLIGTEKNMLADGMTHFSHSTSDWLSM